MPNVASVLCDWAAAGGKNSIVGGLCCAWVEMVGLRCAECSFVWIVWDMLSQAELDMQRVLRTHMYVLCLLNVLPWRKQVTYALYIYR